MIQNRSKPLSFLTPSAVSPMRMTPSTGAPSSSDGTATGAALSSATSGAATAGTSSTGAGPLSSSGISVTACSGCAMSCALSFFFFLGISLSAYTCIIYIIADSAKFSSVLSGYAQIVRTDAKNVSRRPSSIRLRSCRTPLIRKSFDSRQRCCRRSRRRARRLCLRRAAKRPPQSPRRTSKRRC